MISQEMQSSHFDSRAQALLFHNKSFKFLLSVEIGYFSLSQVANL